MNNRLQELTDKIFQEGISKGQEEADLIKAKATADASQLLSDARNEADLILDVANKKAAEIRENTILEVKLAARQAVDALKFEIIHLINGSVTSSEIKAGMSDLHFIQDTIGKMVENWAGNPDMKILIPEKEGKAIIDYFNSIAKGLLDKGFAIETVNEIKTGFQVTSDKGGYKISFTDHDFIAFFQEFLRPKVVELLFGKK